MDALEPELGDPQAFKDRVYKPLEPLNDHLSSPWRPQGDLVAIDNMGLFCVFNQERMFFLWLCLYTDLAVAVYIVLKCNCVNYLKYY